MTSMIESVRIGEHEIDAVRGPDGEGYAALRRMCEALGLQPHGQAEKLRGAAWATTQMICAVAQDGKTRELFCLHVKSVPMWLATIDANRVSEAARPTLEVFQRQAADALYRWATGTGSETPEQKLLAGVRWLQSKVEDQAKQLAVAQPKAEAFDKYLSIDALLSLRDAAKHLGRKQNEWIAELLAERYLYRQRTWDPNRLVLCAYTKWIDAGLFKVRLLAGIDHAQVMVTSQGITHFGQLRLSLVAATDASARA